MKTRLLMGLSLLSALPLAAVTPTVTVTRVDCVGRRLNVTYSIANGPAIVTLEVLTNGVPIASSDLATASGDVNRIVSGASGKLTWKASQELAALSEKDDLLKVAVKAWPLGAPPDYVVFDLDSTDPKADTRFYADAASVPGGVGAAKYKTTHLVMRKIPAGATTSEVGLKSVKNTGNQWKNYVARCTPRLVTLSRDYYLGVYELTQGQVEGRWPDRPSGRAVSTRGTTDWQMKPLGNFYHDEIRGKNLGARWPEGDDPHAVDPGSLLASLRGITGVRLDLPTSAQWEVASRCGTESNYIDGYDSHADYLTNAASSNSLVSLGWCKFEASRPQVVGLKRANPYGLYDMQGNVCEQCLDWFTFSDGSFADDKHQIDPRGPTFDEVVDYRSGGGTRVNHGGSYTSDHVDFASFAKSSNYTKRNSDLDFIGLRLCCDADMSVLNN